MSISDRIEQLTKKENGQPLSVVVNYGFTYEAVKKIDQSLQNTNEEERFSLAVDLFRLWFEAGICDMKERQEEARSIFGQIFDEHNGKRLIYTLTADGKQLRVWYGCPALMEPYHVDSCGKDLLFGVYGHPKVVVRYLKAFCEIYELDEIQVPNGVCIYMKWIHR